MSGVGKRYRKLEERTTLLRSLMPFNKPARSEFWALRGIDLELQQGEVVGVIGSNGAGKSTMLRLLAGVTRPTEGEVEVRGRIAPLLSLGVGFQREMSGRENVFLNGMLLGLSREQVAERFDEVVAFAELGEFIDVPVKFYSSGMYVRLGFAVAVHTDPRVLLVDEVLSVGDIAFQVKCLRRLEEIRGTGATILMVSHQVAAIQQLCPRAMVIRRGHLEFDGPVDGAIATHHAVMASDARDRDGTRLRDAHEPGFVGGVRILQRQLLQDGREVQTVQPHTALAYRIRLAFDQPVDNPGFQFRLAGPDGAWIYARNTPLDLSYRHFQAGEEIDLELAFSADLGHGTHRMQFVAYSGDVRDTLVSDDAGLPFFVEPVADTWGAVDLRGVINLDGKFLC